MASAGAALATILAQAASFIWAKNSTSPRPEESPTPATAAITDSAVRHSARSRIKTPPIYLMQIGGFL